MNDLFYYSTPSQAETSLREVISNARLANQNIKIVIGHITPTQRAETDTTFASQVADLNSRIDSIASSMTTAASPVVVADTDEGYNADADTWDGTHPNAQGEIDIAAAFADAFAQGFGLGQPYPRPLPTVATGPLTAPTLSATSGNGEATLSWTQSPGATAYWVWVKDPNSNNDDWTRLPLPLSMPYDPWTSNNLENGATYQYKLQTAKGNDVGVYSNTVSVTPTGPVPNGVVLSAVSGNHQGTLTWSDAQNSTTYYVWARNLTAGEDWHELPLGLPSGSSPWTSGNLLNGADYQYKLQSMNGLEAGGMSNVVDVTPSGPTPPAPAVSAVSGDHQGVLSWANIPLATSYNVWARNVTAGEDWHELPLGLPSGSSSWTSGNLFNGADYQYKLQAADGYETSPFSNVVDVQPTGPTAAATTVSATSGDHQGTLTWTNIPRATSYNVWTRNVTAGEDWHELPLGLTSSLSPWVSGGLANGGTYQYKFQSVDGYELGGMSNVVTVNPTGPTPGAPVLSGSPGNEVVNLSWQAVTNATSYSIWVRDDSLQEADFTELPEPVSGTSWTLTGMVAGASYTIKIQALNGYISGSFSNQVSAIPTGVLPDAPSLSFSTSGNDVTLSWSKPAHASRFTVEEEDLTGGTGWQPIPTSLPVGAAVNTAVQSFDTWIQFGQTVLYRVIAQNGLLAGGTSNVVRVRLASDEYSQILSFITGEMDTNSVSSDVQQIQFDFSSSCDNNSAPLGCEANAYSSFYELECPGCAWDFKGTIRSTWVDDDPFYADVPNTGLKVYYDIWSNIHYGYVGAAAGISESELLTASHMSSAGLTDPGDDLSVEIGVDLFNTYGPDNVTPSELDQAVRAHLAEWQDVDGDVQVRPVDDFS